MVIDVFTKYAWVKPLRDKKGKRVLHAIIEIVSESKNNKSIIEKNYDKIVLLRKDKLNIVEVLIYKALIDSYISNEEFLPETNVLREYNEMKEEVENAETSVEYTI